MSLYISVAHSLRVRCEDLEAEAKGSPLSGTLSSFSKPVLSEWFVCVPLYPCGYLSALNF